MSKEATSSSCLCVCEQSEDDDAVLCTSPAQRPTLSLSLSNCMHVPSERAMIDCFGRGLFPALTLSPPLSLWPIRLARRPLLPLWLALSIICQVQVSFASSAFSREGDCLREHCFSRATSHLLNESVVVVVVVVVVVASLLALYR